MGFGQVVVLCFLPPFGGVTQARMFFAAGVATESRENSKVEDT